MKYLTTLLVFLFLNTTGFCQVKKKALLVGVGDYPGSQWKDLSSAADLKYLQEALTLQNFTDIKTLVDEKATKEGILNALRQLEAGAEKNDIILFHFSGHGQQIQDNENKDETDGWDEALIPYDAIEGFYSIDYKGDKHLRDDEIQPILTAIRNKIGTEGSLVVTLDACHSGTATRSAQFAVTRGEVIKFKKDPKYTGSDKYVVGDGFADAGLNAANMIVLSASGPNQVNYETKDVNGNGVGSLSYALARALTELPKGANYDMLFNRIKSEIQGSFPQIPMMEGNGKQEIFGSAYTSYDDIIEVRWDNDSTIRIPAGLVHGLSLGSTIDIYQNGDTKVMQATPLEVGNFETVARTSQPATSKVGYHAKWEAAFGVYAADLFINTGKSKPASKVGDQLGRFMSAQQNVTIKKDADYMLQISEKEGNKGIFIELVEKGDSVRWSRMIASGDTLSEKDKQSLLADLRHAMKVKFLRSMRDGGGLIENVKVEILPAQPTIENNEIKVKPNDAFTIRITNNSENDIFYTIINLRPDNKMGVLIPDPWLTPQEFFLKAKSGSFDLTGFTVDKDTPTGQELFKVIISRTPMDLRNVFNATRSKAGGAMTSFESALQTMVETSNTGTRSGRSNVKLGEVGITTVGFTVVK